MLGRVPIKVLRTWVIQPRLPDNHLIPTTGCVWPFQVYPEVHFNMLSPVSRHESFQYLIFTSSKESQVAFGHSTWPVPFCPFPRPVLLFCHQSHLPMMNTISLWTSFFPSYFQLPPITLCYSQFFYEVQSHSRYSWSTQHLHLWGARAPSGTDSLPPLVKAACVFSNMFGFIQQCIFCSFYELKNILVTWFGNFMIIYFKAYLKSCFLTNQVMATSV